MRTPVFKITQNSNDIVINIKAPMAHLDETELTVEDNLVHFYSLPYYLRLQIPGSVENDTIGGAVKIKFEDGHFHINIRKTNPGEHFPDLNMLTKLLEAPKVSSHNQPLIEVLESTEACFSVEEEDLDFFLEQSLEDLDESNLLSGHKYGFSLSKSSIFKEGCEFNIVVDLPDPDHTPLTERKSLREKAEFDAFNADHYLFDLFEHNEQLESVLKFQPYWCKIYEKWQNGQKHVDDIVEFSDDEAFVLKNLPKKEYLIGSELSLYFSLVDIIFSYCYDYRVREGDDNSESGWNIVKLSPTLSWFNVHSDLKSVVCSFYRRCLVYPLYRSWKLAVICHRDVKNVFSLGKSVLLKCLLDIRKIMINCEGYYIFNDLYIEDYCIWIQSASEKKFESLSNSLSEISVSKIDVNLDIDEWEAAGQLAVEENTLSRTMTIDLSTR